MTSLKKKNNNDNLLKAISFLRIQLTYEELGNKLGYGKGTVSKYISGKLPPSEDFLNKFEEVFDIKLSDFETTKIETKKPPPEDEGFSLKEFNEYLIKENEFLKEMLRKK